MDAERGSTNSRESRVIPTFSWLEAYGGVDWPQRLVDLAEGLEARPHCGQLVGLEFINERQVPPSNERLTWMLRNADRLTPTDGRRWRELASRIGNRAAVEAAISALEEGRREDVPDALVLEGPTHADCLIECDDAIVWVEGKRFDWLSLSTTWDVTRDQLARNTEAAWRLSQKAGKDFCVIVCHETTLKHHEMSLIEGYRQQTWAGGWPHVDSRIRSQFSQRLGTLRWSQIADEWPSMRDLHYDAAGNP